MHKRMSNKHTKICLTYYVLRELKVKTKMYHCPPARGVKIHSDSIKCWWQSELTKLSSWHAGMQSRRHLAAAYEATQPSFYMVSVSSSLQSSTYCYHFMQQLCFLQKIYIYPPSKKKTKLYSNVLVALFIIAEIWKQLRCLLVDKWASIAHTSRKVHCSVLKANEPCMEAFQSLRNQFEMADTAWFSLPDSL